MLDISPGDATSGNGSMSRRTILRAGALGAFGLTMPAFLQMQEAMAAEAKKTKNPSEEPLVKDAKLATPKAKSVIQIWLGGGPAHTDTFDPKPTAGPDYTGPYKKTIATNTPGIHIGEKLPLLAKQSDKYSLLRGLTHRTNAHELGAYMMQTGTAPGGELAYPALGAVIAYLTSQNYKGDLPPYITATRPLGRFAPEGFLGGQYKSFTTGGAPNSAAFNVEGLVAPSYMTGEQLKNRRSLLESVDSFARKMDKDDTIGKFSDYQQRAYGMILGDAKKAFDLKEEKKEVREKYGREVNEQQACLLARRLVERGVPFVTVNWGGWDTHKKHFESMDKKLPQLDQAVAALLEDLDSRGLLETTIVTVGGEFGRTPEVLWNPPWNGGRGHFGTAFSWLVAGGGFKGGSVVGMTDNRGERVVQRPIYPWDLSASIYQLMGIDPNGHLPHPHGCTAYVTPRTGGDLQSGGVLKEIM